MSIDLCQASLFELGCLIDALEWVPTSTWLASPGPSRRRRRAQHPGDFTASVRAAADDLPLELAQALWLVDVCGCTYANGAGEVGIDRAAFATRVRDARQSIHRAVS